MIPQNLFTSCGRQNSTMAPLSLSVWRDPWLQAKRIWRGERISQVWPRFPDDWSGVTLEVIIWVGPLDLLRGGFFLKRVKGSALGVEEASDHSGERARQPVPAEGGLGWKPPRTGAPSHTVQEVKSLSTTWMNPEADFSPVKTLDEGRHSPQDTQLRPRETLSRGPSQTMPKHWSLETEREEMDTAFSHKVYGHVSYTNTLKLTHTLNPLNSIWNAFWPFHLGTLPRPTHLPHEVFPLPQTDCMAVSLHLRKDTAAEVPMSTSVPTSVSHSQEPIKWSPVSKWGNQGTGRGYAI